jgi:hypothetical protein
VTAEDVVRWKAHRLASGRSIKTVANDIGELRPIWNWGKQNHKITFAENPFSGIAPRPNKRAARPPRGPYSDDEAARILSAARKERAHRRCGGSHGSPASPARALVNWSKPSARMSSKIARTARTTGTLQPRRSRDNHGFASARTQGACGRGVLERCSRIGRLAALLVALPLTFAASARAGQFEDATAAAKRGDYATAFKDILPLAEAGDARAQFNLGLLYAQGLGVPQNYAEAAKWYRLAANQGVAEAQFNLGVLYHHGIGVPQNYAEAAKWYRLAANQGDAVAQYNLGDLYAHGHGVPQNYAEAYFWFDLAAARLPPGLVQQFAEKIRDELATLLRPEDLAQAQQRASAWQPTAQTPQ